MSRVAVTVAVRARRCDLDSQILPGRCGDVGAGWCSASLGRHTAMAFGVTIGVVAIFQFGLGTVLELAKAKFVEAYLIPVWAAA